ncbi:MAG: SRPBCC family protein [Candidatus Limnocylindrales bacterium]
MANERSLARGLGLYGVGLGLAQLAAPGWVATLIGVDQKGQQPDLMRLVGARELVSGLGLLTSRTPKPWLWLRVAGDLMDLALLGRAMSERRTQVQRASGAIAGKLGVTAIDLLTSFDATMNDRGGRNGSALHGQDEDGQRRDDGSTRSREKDGEGLPGPFANRAVRKAVTIDRSPQELFAYWRDVANLPRFMRHLEDVRVIDERRSHWTVKAPAGMTVEWDAEISAEEQDRSISWRAMPDSTVRHEGTVRFEPAPGDRGTEVHVELLYAPPLGPIGVALAKLLGEEPAQQVSDDLRRFKQVMETGQVVTSDAVLGDRRLRQHPAQPQGSNS